MAAELKASRADQWQMVAELKNSIKAVVHGLAVITAAPGGEDGVVLDEQGQICPRAAS